MDKRPGVVSGFVALLLVNVSSVWAQDLDDDVGRPNVILLMADDLGWGDVGYNGNPVVMTPAIDLMAEEGVVLERFYTASSICSPTRASVLTGRHPYRMGIWAAHTGGMRRGEITLAEILKDEGYRTGFFGKWHLGHIEAERAHQRGPRGVYSPPWLHGFDETFATESAVPTWNPTVTPFDIFGNVAGDPWKTDGLPYLHNGEKVTENLDGDNSRIIMDRVLPFVREADAAGEPFLAVVWFHTPHEPVVAGPEYLAQYAYLPNVDQRHFYGSITAMDDQIARLRDELDRLGIADDTIIFFTSDNGPSGGAVRDGVASAGPFRGHKHQHYDGGVRTPSLVVWPGALSARRTQALTSTTDYLPTVLDLVQMGLPNRVQERPMDGMSFAPALRGEDTSALEDRFIVSGYKRLYKGEDGIALVSGPYKLHRHKTTGALSLYDLSADPSERIDISAENPEVLAQLTAQLAEWEASAVRSAMGADYQH